MDLLNIALFQLHPYDRYYKKVNQHKYNAYKKDLSFEHEKEFRFIAILKSDKISDEILGFELPFEEVLENMEIIGHPRQPHWIRQVLDENLKVHGINNEIKKSQIRLR